MKKPANLILLVFLLVGSFLSGNWYSKRSTRVAAESDGRRILYYVDPMHPAYKSDKPGIAQDCGMKLEPVYAGEGPAAEGSRDDPPSLPTGTVHVSPEKQQLIGIRLAAVEKTSGSQPLRTVGRVTPDENLVYRVLTGTDGWVREIHGGTTGSVVQKDQLLATLYNPQFLTSEQALFYALNAIDRFKKEGMDSPEQITASNAQLRAAEDSLHALGMGDIQIQEISKTRKVTRDIAIRAPVASLVVARNIYPGLRFERGTELYRLADLSRVWILADLFQNESRYFRPGAAARVTIPHQPTTFTARVSDVPPQFDPTTRTLKVRLDADNPGFVLRPDMFVDVELPVKLPAGITVPADAVLDSGLKKTVFVDRGNGYFEPRLVETGWRYGDRVEIVKGLEPGERVVTSGNFLIDSESRMKLAAAGMQGTASTVNEATKDPVCGMDVDAKEAAAAGRKSEYDGKTYYFCSDHCKKQFEQNPRGSG